MKMALSEIAPERVSLQQHHYVLLMVLRHWPHRPAPLRKDSHGILVLLSRECCRQPTRAQRAALQSSSSHDGHGTHTAAIGLGSDAAHLSAHAHCHGPRGLRPRQFSSTLVMRTGEEAGSAGNIHVRKLRTATNQLHTTRDFFLLFL